MATKAIVFVGTDPKKTKGVLEKLPQPNYSLTGRFDGAALVTNETPKAVSEQVFNQIRSLDGVTRTETYPVLREVTRQGIENWPVRGYVLIRTEPKKTEQVFGSLAGLQETGYAASIAGRYDVAAQIGARTWDDFTNTVINRIRGLDGVVSTETLLIVN